MADDAPFLAACRGEVPSHTPVWFMRQAGRALPEYRRAKGSVNILDALRDPALTCEITLQPVRRLGVDAAILYSDIVAPVQSIGFGVEIRSGVGPVVAEPFRAVSDLDRLRGLEPEVDMPWQAEAIRLLVKELDVPLIGFAGAPFTVASYLVEGGPSREQARTRSLMLAEPDLWAALVDRLADLAVASLRSQIAAGASAVQLFDSWAGSLSAETYERHVLPATAKVFAGLADLGVPRIHFGVGTGELLGLIGGCGADVVGVDWRVPLDEAARRAPGRPLQGNLDPAVLHAPPAVVEAATADVLRRGRAAPGHVFNLGHGVTPDADPDVLARIVELVHRTGA
jgi:uroporphyrinogen decarboxylase